MNTEQEFAEDPKDLGEPSFIKEEEDGKEDSFSFEKNDQAKEGIPSHQERREESSPLSQFISQFEEAGKPEEKIRLALDFMRASLSQVSGPRFKDFWEGRRLCLPLFKSAMTPKIRSLCWAEYVELSAEARRLKEILDEQSAFAAEQIELAIQAIESDLEHEEKILTQVPELPFIESSDVLREKEDVYNRLQKELNFLNTLASRINALRKEVVKTEMRIRHKNKFFERLSTCGDRVFPKRKDLIKAISEEFIADVEAFIQFYFKEESSQTPPLFVLREEIKALQAIAKQLTLNTHAFTETRLKLSECWDKVKWREKERKKEFAIKKQTYKQNVDLVLKKIQEWIQAGESEDFTLEAVERKSDEILGEMQALELGREEVRFCKEELHRARRIFLDKLRGEESKREKKEQEEQRQKQEKIAGLRSQLQLLLSQAEQLELEKLLESHQALSAELESLSFTKSEKQVFDRLLKQLKDVIGDKKEKVILNLSEDDLHYLEQLKNILRERKEQRQEIRDQLESYRKTLGGSGFDFEKAMQYRELIEAEKERLDKANSAILEIEEKISQIEG